MLTRRLLQAEVVYNGLGSPRRNGAVVLQGERGAEQVIAVDDAQLAAQNFPTATVEQVGFAISTPLVNAHSHLDLSHMPFSPGSYDAFIDAVIAHAASDARGLGAAKTGVSQLLARSTRVVGDIVTDESVMRYLLAQPELSGVAYWEVWQPDPAQAEQTFNQTVARLRALRQLERPGGMRVGLSPHSPHTVSAPLLQKLAALAKHNRLPLQIHVAESPEELAFHRNGTGSLADFIRARGVAVQASGLSPVQYLKQLGVLDAAPTLVHMVQVDEQDVRDVQKAGGVVVHCPRSNTALNCGRFPWELYAKHGVTVAFGTDSLGSSPSLSLEAEVLAARQLHGDKADDRALVWAATKGGYRALGMQPPRFVRGDNASNVYVWS